MMAVGRGWHWREGREPGERRRRRVGVGEPEEIRGEDGMAMVSSRWRRQKSDMSFTARQHNV